MLGISKKSPLVILLLVFACLSAHAQTDELLPEVDAYGKLSSSLRLWFQAKQTRESGDPVKAEIGPSLDFYLKPFVRLKGATEFDLDDSKSRPLVFSIGYRYLPEANGAPSTNRMEPVVTFNFPLKGRVLLSDRNRGDLDWQNGNFTWRYRNRIQFERTFATGSYHFSPYASAEFFYASQYAKWSDTGIYIGCLFPFRRHFEFNPYYEHQNSTGTSPNQQLNQLGLMLNLYFAAR
jgi:Protein of unknown function (DUF2490)